MGNNNEGEPTFTYNIFLNGKKNMKKNTHLFVKIHLYEFPRTDYWTKRKCEKNCTDFGTRETNKKEKMGRCNKAEKTKIDTAHIRSLFMYILVTLF